MPPTRSLRPRTVNNENDENVPIARATRAKTAALSSTEDTAAAVKKPLQSKRATTTTTTAAQRRRPALGDVSNVTKAEPAETKDTKKTTTKASLSSRTTAHAGGVQKLTRGNSSRAALGVKDTNAKRSTAAEPKRPGSGSGVGGSAVKRSSSQKASVKEEEASQAEPPRKKLDIEKKPTLEAEPAQPRREAEPQPQPHDPLDKDTEDLGDPLTAAEYVVEIFDYLRSLEAETMPNPDYMEHQPELEWRMRGILVDWLIEVHTRFRLLPETLFLAVNLIDRFLSTEVVAVNRLQLVGVTAMFIASKYEEVLSPHVVNFSNVSDGTFSEREILEAERHVLAALEYNLSYPNPMNFLRRISKADNFDIATRTLGKYLIEISLVDHRFMPYYPSLVAAAAMYLARLILHRGPWDELLTRYAGYTEEEILPVVRLMIDYLRRPIVHEAIFKKYASKKFLKASIITRQWARKYAPVYLDGYEPPQ
ncbi:hypothetical protein VTN49DRAFT_7466 [Thermomyces lanuginosus]|uniref:uncharacterized protein n=1 Tax=Thermomyces lanuginosus TaxID=5541 RepID=UPI003741FF59